MKRIVYLFILVFALQSCDDFLDRKPQDFGSESAFLRDVNDLQYAANTYYALFPSFGNWAGGLYKDDEASDNQCGGSPNNLFYKGSKQQPIVDNSQWKFNNLRGINFTIEQVEKNIAAGVISGTPELINHYLGELYFFRAYDTFRLLSSIGDAPILAEFLEGEKSEELIKASKRAPRNEVARFILSDLKIASGYLLSKAPQNGRLSKDAAFLMSARVALFEATWLKYHANTPFVPDYPNSPYAKKWGAYSYPAGSLEAESNYFFDTAIAYADSVAGRRKLDPTYQEVFNNISGKFSGDEVILARYYVKGINGHAVSNGIGSAGGGTGYTYDLVKSFLMKSGRPYYAAIDNEYKGDRFVFEELTNRDLRLVESIKPSFKIKPGMNGEQDTLVISKPPILSTGNEQNTTGYEVYKYVSPEPGQNTAGSGTSATPIFRSAEAKLIYLEAYYERNHSLGGNCDKYWKELRARAGVSTDYHLTIESTDLNRESDLGKYSGYNKLIDKTLYNIRRERRCEFIAEGMRNMDLRRWRSLDNMKDYIIRGFNLWTEMYKAYEAKLEPGKNVSPNSAVYGPYIQPYGIVSSNSAYLGYNFQIAHYLEPIPISEFRLTAPYGGSIEDSPIHQNPGWSKATVEAAADNSDSSLH